MRPGCDRPAAARLSYDTISCQVWLDQIPERLGPVQEICQFHAERLTVPRGWMLCDRRVEAPALFEPDDRVTPLVAPAVPPSVPGSPASPQQSSPQSPRRAHRRRHPSSTARQLFDDSPRRVAEPVPARDELDLDSDLDLELDAATLVDLDSDLDRDVETAPAPVQAEAPAPLTVVPEPAPDSAPDPVTAAPGGLDEVLVAAGRADTARRPLPEHAEIMAEIVSVDPDDELPESLRATSPLLARAFRATGPQRSVLSAELANPPRDEPTD
jgi:Protein of unknown function (DUF3499)